MRPRETWTTSQWAERAPRILGKDESSEPGAFRWDRTPYGRDIADAVDLVAVEQIGCLKGAQIGWSEIERNIFGKWIDLDPDPLLILCPDKKTSEDYVEERLTPLLRNTPALTRHISSRAWDSTKDRVKLDTMSIFTAWGGSSQSVKSRPIRYLSVQEPDEIPAHSGTGGSPIAKAEKRLTTYRDKGRSRVLVGGTPTTRRAWMWKWWMACPDKRYFWVPCPHCGTYQRLVWGDEDPNSPGVKWPKGELELLDRAQRADRIDTGNLAWYRCCHCQEPIRDHHKPMMLRAGRWLTEGVQSVLEGGEVLGTPPRTKRVGFHLSGLYSPWVTFSTLAAEFIRAKEEPELLMDFINQRLAEPYEEKVVTPKESDIQVKVAAAKAAKIAIDVVPAWAGKLFLTVDTQKNGFWYLLRAWGWRYRSRLLRYGFVRTFDEIWQIGARGYPRESGTPVGVDKVLVDVGGGTQNEHGDRREDEVYRFAERAPGWILPLRGSSNPQWRNVVAKALSTRKYTTGEPIILLWIAANRLKDELTRHIRLPVGSEGEWELNELVGPDYVAQMTDEEKIVIEPRTGEQGWVSRHKNNHLWDCEVYQFAAADPTVGEVHLIPSPEELKAYEAFQRQQRERRPPELTTPDGRPFLVTRR